VTIEHQTIVQPGDAAGNGGVLAAVEERTGGGTSWKIMVHRRQNVEIGGQNANEASDAWPAGDADSKGETPKLGSFLGGRPPLLRQGVIDGRAGS